MIAACAFGTLGHLAATFLPVFGVIALFATLEEPVWGLLDSRRWRCAPSSAG